MTLRGLRRLAGRVVPTSLRAALADLGPYGFVGRYDRWADAEQHAEDPAPEMALARVAAATAAVRAGTAEYEQDSVPMAPTPEVGHILRIVNAVAGRRPHVRVIDFGGSLGSKYFWVRRNIGDRVRIDWTVVELPMWVERGNAEFATDHLRFQATLGDAAASGRPDVVLACGSLQYVEEAERIVREMAAAEPEYILFDRTPYAVSGKPEIVLQRVNPRVYPLAMPSWLFAETDVRAWLGPRYRQQTRYGYRGTYSRRADFLGHVFERTSGAQDHVV